MYDIKNVLDNDGIVYAGRIIIDNKDGTISKFWLCEDDRQLRKSTEDYRLEMISKIKDEYKNLVAAAAFGKDVDFDINFAKEILPPRTFNTMMKEYNNVGKIIINFNYFTLNIKDYRILFYV